MEPPQTRRSILHDPPAALVLAVCAVILCLRRAGAVTNPQFWAEDANLFENAYEFGWHALAMPFAGYLHSALRVIAQFTVMADPARAPWIFLGCSVVVTLYVAGLALSPRCPLPRFCGAAALAVVLVPDTFEVLLNVVNLQWVIGAGMVLLLILGDAKGPWQNAHDLAAAVAMGLTGPFCIMLAPLFVARAWSRGSRASALLAAAVIASAIVQGWFLLGAPPLGDALPGARFLPQVVLPAVGRRVGGSLLVGALMSADTDLYVGTLVGAGTLLGVAYLAFTAGPRRLERALLGLAFLVLLCAAVYRLRHKFDEAFIPGSASRYFYIPQLIVMWLLLAAAELKGRAGRLAPALLAWAVLVNAPRYRERALVDMHWSRYESSIREGRPVIVPVNPPGWIMPLPERRR
jgi:hypothetical protein